MTSIIDTKDLKKLFEKEEPITLLDVRRKSDYQANPNIIKGATWRDPEKISDWVKQLPTGQRTVVYCVKGGSVTRSTPDRSPVLSRWTWAPRSHRRRWRRTS